MIGKKQLEINTVSSDIILGNKGPVAISPHSVIRYVWTTSQACNEIAIGDIHTIKQKSLWWTADYLFIKVDIKVGNHQSEYYLIK